FSAATAPKLLVTPRSSTIGALGVAAWWLSSPRSTGLDGPRLAPVWKAENDDLGARRRLCNFLQGPHDHGRHHTQPRSVVKTRDSVETRAMRRRGCRRRASCEAFRTSLVAHIDKD